MECLSQKENPRNINGSEGDFCVEISAFQLINLIAYNFPILILSIKIDFYSMGFTAELYLSSFYTVTIRIEYISLIIPRD